VVNGQQLRNATAHRHAENMGLFHPQRIHQPHDIGGHVVQTIGGRGRLACRDLRQNRFGPAIDPRRRAALRQADIAVVKQHHTIAKRRKSPRKARPPMRHGTAQPAHKHQRHAIGRAQFLVFQENSVCFDLHLCPHWPLAPPCTASPALGKPAPATVTLGHNPTPTLRNQPLPP
jgi:hypothetical protein